VLIALLIVGMLLYQQLGPGAIQEIDQAQIIPDTNAPRIPTSPKDVEQFGADMNDYINEAAAKRASELEGALAQ
jgi:hypothetical protein